MSTPREDDQHFEGLDNDAPDEEAIPLVQHAVEAALALDRDERAWALVSLAVELTSLEQYVEGLQVLRASIKLGASERSRLAALTCATAIRCRQGEHEDAIRIAKLVLSSTGDVELLRPLGRILAARAEMTGDERLRQEGERILDWAGFEESFAAAS